MTSQKKAELFDTFCRLKSATMVAPPSQNKLCSVRTIVKKKEKETCEVIAAAMPVGMKILHLLQNTFLCHTENAAFIWVQDSYKKGIPIVSQEKAK